MNASKRGRRHQNSRRCAPPPSADELACGVMREVPLPLSPLFGTTPQGAAMSSGHGDAPSRDEASSGLSSPLAAAAPQHEEAVHRSRSGGAGKAAPANGHRSAATAPSAPARRGTAAEDASQRGAAQCAARELRRPDTTHQHVRVQPRGQRLPACKPASATACRCLLRRRRAPRRRRRRRRHASLLCIRSVVRGWLGATAIL